MMIEVQKEEFDKRLRSYAGAGAQFGADLAKALLLAVSRGGGDREAKAHLSAIVMREILAAVERLRELGVPALLVQAYERACRRACRDELLQGLEPTTSAVAA